MEWLSSRILGIKIEQWIIMVFCSAILALWAFEQFIHQSPSQAQSSSIAWFPLVASVFALTGITLVNYLPRWFRVQRLLLWSSLLLMVWIANGILFDFFAMAGLIGDPATGLKIGVYWLGMTTRIMALAVAVVLARLALARPTSPGSIRRSKWYGYAAFVFALPYPVFRIWWTLGGKIGLTNPDAASHGFAPILLAIPWLLAAALSLLLVSPRRWMPRWLLLILGWSATVIVGTIGPAACWSMITKLVNGNLSDQAGVATWVFCLFYASWLFWAIAAGAATLSYQLHSASLTDVNLGRA